jgi:hypothetical protein
MTPTGSGNVERTGSRDLGGPRPFVDEAAVPATSMSSRGGAPAADSAWQAGLAETTSKPKPCEPFLALVNSRSRTCE